MRSLAGCTLSLALLGWMGAGLTGAAPLAPITAVARDPAVITAVEEACIDRSPPRWAGEPAFKKMWEVGAAMAAAAVAGGEACPTIVFEPHHLRHGVEVWGPGWTELQGRADAEGCLDHWASTYGGLLHEIGPQDEPPGDLPVLSGELPRWNSDLGPPREIRDPRFELGSVFVAVQDAQDPHWVVAAIGFQAAALLAAGRSAEGVEAFRAGLRFIRILARGHVSNRDFAFVDRGLRLAFSPWGGVAHHLRLMGWRDARTAATLAKLGDEHRERLVSWSVFLDRDMEFRRCGIRLVDERVGPMAPILFGDGMEQLERIRRWALEGAKIRGADIGSMHPVIATFLPSLGRLRDASRNVANETKFPGLGRW